MPKAVADVLADFSSYEEETGGTNDTPIGTFQTFVMEGDNHPRGSINEKTGVAELFGVARIDPEVESNESKGRTLTFNLSWSVPETNAQGEPYDDDKRKMMEGINRRQFREFMQAVFGEQFEDYDYGILPEAGDTEEEVLEVFKAIAKELPHKRLTFKSTKNKKNPQYTNSAFSAPKESDTSF